MTYDLAHFIFACYYYLCSIYLRKIIHEDPGESGPTKIEKVIFVVLAVLNVAIPSIFLFLPLLSD